MRARRAAGRLALLVTALCVTAPSAYAQSRSTAAIRGTVLAESGPIAGAEVVLTHRETGVQRAAQSRPDGRFLLPLLPPGGPYEITIAAFGYATVTRSGLRLRVGETLDLDVELRAEAIPLEGIRVQVDQDRVFDPDRIGPVTLLDTEAVSRVPLLARDLTQLTVLSPLVKRSDEGFSIGGQNDRYNALLVDGVSAQDAFGVTPGGIPGGQAGARLIPLDAVAQYEVRAAPFDVRLSGFTGGVLNAVTRSGTNRWEGSAFAYTRQEALTGDLVLADGARTAIEGVQRVLTGFTLGGPLVRDRLHLFVAGELEDREQPPDGANVGRDPASLTRISPQAADTLVDVFADGYGVDAGAPGAYPLDRRVLNLFARLDADLSARHRLTVRYILADARDDDAPNRTLSGPYGLGSNATLRESRSHSTSAQLFSTFSPTWSNELTLSLQSISDDATAVRSWPQVETDLLSTIELPSGSSAAFMRPVRAGGAFYGQVSELDQTILRVTDDLTATLGSHTVTLGLTAARYGIEQRYVPGGVGAYRFASLSALKANMPEYYERTILLDGASETVDPSFYELGAYLQDEFRVGQGLTLRYGVRVDQPYAAERPAQNVEVLRVFGRSTSSVPSGLVAVSPRFGFNWQSGSERRTQVRGGIGIFTGRIPFLWLTNGYTDNGLRTATLVCQGVPDGRFNAAPPFDPSTIPTTCNNPIGSPNLVRRVTLFDESFRLPQDLKLSLGVDRELGEGWSASAGVVFTRALSQLFPEDMNIGVAVEEQRPEDGYTLGFGGRPNFGVPTGDGYAPVRRDGRFGSVIVATNRSDDHAWAFTAELRGRLSDAAAVQLGYSFSRSLDRMSLTQPDLLSNFGLNPVPGHPNRPPLSTSRFDRPHKLVASLWGRPIPGFDGFEVSLLYTGESGLPYSYVYRGDLNGDGYPGPGPAFDHYNDPLFVPAEASGVPSTPATWILLSGALESDPCLAAFRGRMIERNGCRAPWQHRLDLKLAQRLEVGRLDLSLDLDLVNALNALNSNWGRIRSTPSVVELLETDGRAECLGCVGDLRVRWGSGVLPMKDAEGRLRSSEPWTLRTPDSQWQAQIGMRVRWR